MNVSESMCDTIAATVELILMTTPYQDLNQPTNYTCPILQNIVLMRYDYSQEAIDEYYVIMQKIKHSYIERVNKEIKSHIHHSSDAFVTHHVALGGKTYGEARTQWLNFILSTLTGEESACLTH